MSGDGWDEARRQWALRRQEKEQARDMTPVLLESAVRQMVRDQLALTERVEALERTLDHYAQIGKLPPIRYMYLRPASPAGKVIPFEKDDQP